LKLASVVLSGASIVALSLLAASPASAAGNAIDPGDSLYAINCDSSYNDFQLFSVDSTTAFSTPIGEGTGEVANSCAGQPAYDATTGQSYYIDWAYGEGEHASLATINVTTGESTVIDGFYYNNGEFPEYIWADALAIGADGAAYILADNAIWSVDLDSAFVEPIAETIDAYAFAYDAVTGKFYAVDPGNDIFEINVETGEVTDLGSVVFPDESYRTYSLQFDEAGTFWVEVDTYNEEDNLLATLWSFTLTTIETPVFSGIFTDDPFYTEAILIIPGDAPVAPAEPALAATGADLASVLPWGIGAGVIVLAGGVLLILRSRRKPAVSTSVAAAPELEQKD